jgi:hypothetical protein
MFVALWELRSNETMRGITEGQTTDRLQAGWMQKKTPSPM